MKDQRVKLHDRRAVQGPLVVRDDVSDEISILTARARVLFRVRKCHCFVNIQKGDEEKLNKKYTVCVICTHMHRNNTRSSQKSLIRHRKLQRIIHNENWDASHKKVSGNNYIVHLLK